MTRHPKMPEGGSNKPVAGLPRPSATQPAERCPGAIQGASLWRVGHKVPINVYDGNRPVCQCQTALDAKLIVCAVNEYLKGRKP